MATGETLKGNVRGLNKPLLAWRMEEGAQPKEYVDLLYLESGRKQILFFLSSF